MAGPLLQGTLTLHDIADVEALARKALQDHLRQGAGRGQARTSWLNEDDHEDALTYLIATAWNLSRRYGPDADHPAIQSDRPFGLLCYWLMRRRIVDWYRQRYGSTRYKTRPPLVPLDDHHQDDTGSSALDPAELLCFQLDMTDAEQAAYLTVALPFVESGLTEAGFAREEGMPRAWVEQGLALCRTAMRRNGLAPESIEEPCQEPSSAAAAGA